MTECKRLVKTKTRNGGQMGSFYRVVKATHKANGADVIVLDGGAYVQFCKRCGEWF